MRYLPFLRAVHEALEPRTYLEVGVRHGDSLALAQASSIGVDPAYELRMELPAGTALFRETSDDFFAREAPLEPFGGAPADLAFIDGMHLAEFALRDFINVERHARWTSVVVFDDILPRSVDEAARDRHTRAWTGDVYKILGILAEHRPDLVCLRVDTQPTGLLLVLGLDPTSRVLRDRYEQIAAEAVVPDPQVVPDDVLERHGVIEPERVLQAGFWSFLREARAQGVPAHQGVRDLRRQVAADVGWTAPSPLRRLLSWGR